MIGFMHDVGVTDIDILKSTNYNYESQYSSNKFLGNKSCVKSCQNPFLFENTHCFPKTNIVFQHVHFYPIVFKRKIVSVLEQNI